jgi:hypothetical protein
MTEVPPAGDDELDDPWHDQISAFADEYGAPDVQSIVALILAIGSLSGYGLLSGSAYVFPYLSDGTDKTRLILSGLVGAALAVAPIWLGWRAAARTLVSDPRWVGMVARAAVLLGLISLVLRLVITVISAATSDPNGFGRF